MYWEGSLPDQVKMNIIMMLCYDDNDNDNDAESDDDDDDNDDDNPQWKPLAP